MPDFPAMAGGAALASAKINEILLLGVAGSVSVLGGYFVNPYGRQVGNAFNPAGPGATIPQGNGSNAGVSLATIYGGEIPTGAVGAKIRISGDVYLCEGKGDATIETDFETNPSRYIPIIADPECNGFGRVC